ncbi:MAG: EAL domain-containing protein [Pseudomonadota bacterium]
MRFAVVLTLLSIVAADIAAQIPLAREFPFQRYRQQDGLSRSLVLSLDQDSDGYLWLGTYAGVNRFDGVSFTNMTTRHGLRDNFTNVVYAGADDRLWVGDANGGLTLLRNSSVVATFDPIENKETPIRSLLEFGDYLYIGTEYQGMQRLSLTDPNAKIEPARLPIPEHVLDISDLSTVDNKTIWFLDVDGAAHFVDVGASEYHKIEQDTFVTVVHAEPDLGLFAGSMDGRIGKWNGQNFDWGEPLSENAVFSLLFRGDELEWVQVGLELINAVNQDLRYETGGTFGAVMIDREGVIWSGTSDGLLRYLGERFNVYPIDKANPSTKIFSMLPDVDGDLWLGTELGVAVVKADGSINYLAEQEVLPPIEARGMARSPDGQSIWVSHMFSAVYQIDIQSQSAERVFPNEDVDLLNIQIGPDGVVWAGSYDGKLFRFDPESESLNVHDMGLGNAIYGFAIDRSGTAWFTSNSLGVFKIDGNHADAKPEKVIDIEAFGDSSFITYLSLDYTGEQLRIWLTGTNGGLFYFQEGKLVRLAISQMLSDQTLDNVQAVGDGTIIFSSDRGIYQYDLQREVLDHYAALDGLTPISVTTNAAHRFGDQFMWLGTNDGIATMDLTVPMAPPEPPQSSVIKVESAGQVLSTNGNDNTELSASGLLFEYAAVSTHSPRGIEFSHRLVGADGSWNEVGTNVSVEYPILMPGEYRFEVRAKGVSGEWGPIDTFSFVIPTPFWRTPWFTVLCLTAAAVLILLGVQLRLRAIAQANKRLTAEVAARTRSIEEANKQLEFQANNDELTELTNRRAFGRTMSEIATHPDNADKTFLAFLDLDRFKVVNDSAGHAAGDALLKLVADVLRASVRNQDTAARLGGDEFALILRYCSEEQALQVAERIRSEIYRLDFQWEGETYRIGASIGVVPLSASPDNLEELQKLADAACYEAKASGRNRVQLVSQDSESVAAHRGDIRWVQKLTAALDSDDFELFGQQIQATRNAAQDVNRIEVLLKLNDVKNGRLIPTSAFAAAAERYSLLTRLDEWTISRVLDRLMHSVLPSSQRQQYWVSLSGASIGDPHFAENAVTQIEALNLPPKSLNFQLTETAAIRNVDQAVALIHALRSLGCEFSLDDFGMTQSAFNSLKRLEVDFLKIDGQLIRGLASNKTGQIFVQSIIDVARVMGIRVVAKAVENIEDLHQLRNMGVDYVQGHQVHRPEILAAGELTDTIKVSASFFV